MGFFKPVRTNVPSPKEEGTIVMENMAGGLNTYELPYRIGKEESPDMKNLMWKDGALRSRDGQAWLNYKKLGTGYSVYSNLFYGMEFYHIGNKIYALSGKLEERTAKYTQDTVISDIAFSHVKSIVGGTYQNNEITVTGDSCTVVYYITDIEEICDITTLCGISPSEVSRGTFFQYQDYLFYKAKNVYIRIGYNDYDSFVAENVIDVSYIPTILINCDARNGSGDEYQPENSLSSKKKITFNVSLETRTAEVTDGNHRFADGREETKTIPFTDTTEYPYSIKQMTIYSGNGIKEYADNIGYSYEPYSRTIYLDEAVRCQGVLGGYHDIIPETEITAEYRRYNYYLPVMNPETVIVSIRAIMSNTNVFTDLIQSTAVISSDPSEWNPNWDGDYVFWAPTGHILFKNPPYYFDPFINNTIEVIYDLPNYEAMNPVMSCNKVIVYGGDTSMCIIMAGSETQKNVFFWNGNNVSMDATYFPVLSYNLVGGNHEKITGFGIQQNILVIFKENSLWKTTIGTQTVNGRVLITFDITGVNSKIGCDLPYTIQLIDNNLIFCNTTAGIHYLANTSSADENNVIGISKKVNGTPKNPGILKKASDAESVYSYDDDERYILLIGDEAYVWDYVLSSYNNPSFFFMKGISAVGFTKNGLLTHHLNSEGQISVIGDLTLSEEFDKFSNTDYGEAIHKLYTTPTFYFGSFDNLKDVVKMEIQMSHTAVSDVSLTYSTDCGTRRDLTDLFGGEQARNLMIRNLFRRNLGTKPYTFTYTRRPMTRYVRWFSVTFESDLVGGDMSISAIQIFYKYMGRLR